MDKKEASFILANIDRRVCDDELNEALDMAIKALDQEPKTDSWSIKDVADTFKKHGLIREQEPCEDAIDRAEAIKIASGYCHPANVAKELAKLPPVNPIKTGHCKDCKWWKDSDGTYCRGVHAESKCPINRIEVLEGNGYCYMFEPQESEKINCKSTKCENCINHNYCDYEPQERSEKQ